MYAVDIIGQMGCTQYTETIEDAYKIAMRSNEKCIITFLGAIHDRKDV